DGAAAPCGADGAAYSGLADGSMHVFTVRAADALGNTGAPAERRFTVDAVGPTTTISAPADGATVGPAGQLVFSAEGPATFECDLGPGFAPCGSPTAFQLEGGSYTFAVRATDSVGNVGPAAATAFTVDAQPPTATITAPANGALTAAAGELAFSVDE